MICNNDHWVSSNHSRWLLGFGVSQLTSWFIPLTATINRRCRRSKRSLCFAGQGCNLADTTNRGLWESRFWLRPTNRVRGESLDHWPFAKDMSYFVGFKLQDIPIIWVTYVYIIYNIIYQVVSWSVFGFIMCYSTVWWFSLVDQKIHGCGIHIQQRLADFYQELLERQQQTEERFRCGEAVGSLQLPGSFWLTDGVVNIDELWHTIKYRCWLVGIIYCLNYWWW